MTRTADLVVREVRIVDPITGRASRPTDIAIRRDRIWRIEREIADVATPSELRLPDHFVIAGLFDSHVHLSFDGGNDPRGSFGASTDRQVLDLALRNAQAALRSGVTTVRDCGFPAHLLADFVAMVRGRNDVPTILHSGAPLCRPGGHLHFLGGSVASRQATRELLRSQREAGATWVKVMASGGGMTPGTNPAALELDPEMIGFIVAEAERWGMRVAAHCHASAAVRACIDAGVRTIEHASMVGHDGAPEPDDGLLRRAAETGVWIGPTVIGALRVADEIERQGAPYNSADRNSARRLRARFTNVSRFVEAGVHIVAGTDAGAAGTGFQELATELRLYVDAGMSPAMALIAATSGAAEAMGASKTGSVREGHAADLVVVRASPLRDLATLLTPVLVIKHGRVVTAP